MHPLIDVSDLDKRSFDFFIVRRKGYRFAEVTGCGLWTRESCESDIRNCRRQVKVEQSMVPLHDQHLPARQPLSQVAPRARSRMPNPWAAADSDEDQRSETASADD